MTTMNRCNSTFTIWLILAALLAVTGCSQPISRPVQGWQAPVSDGRETVLDVPDGGPIVTVPKGASSGAGKLRVSRLDPALHGGLSSRAAGWQIELSESQLRGEATIAFAFTPTHDEPAPLVGYLDTSGELVPVPVTVDGGRAIVRTSHFSNWFVDFLVGVREQALRALDTLYSPLATGLKPECAKEEEARSGGVSVNAEDGHQRVLWCLGMEDNRRVLKVVNTRSYAVSVDVTPGLVLRNPPAQTDIEQVFAHYLDHSAKKGNSKYLLPPRARFEFTVTANSGTVGVLIMPSVPAFLATAAKYAADTVLMLKEWSGGKLTAEVLGRAATGVLCASDITAVLTTTINDAVDAAAFLHTALGTMFSCFEKALNEALGPGLLSAPLIAGVAWLATGVLTAAKGLGAAADTALNPSSFGVIITLPEQQVSPDPFLGSWYVHGGQLSVGPDTAQLTGPFGQCAPEVYCTLYVKFRVTPYDSSRLKLTTKSLKVLDPQGQPRPVDFDRPQPGDYYLLRLLDDRSLISRRYSARGEAYRDDSGGNGLGNPYLCRPNRPLPKCGA
jgi:hypothetical protein